MHRPVSDSERSVLGSGAASVPPLLEGGSEVKRGGDGSGDEGPNGEDDELTPNFKLPEGHVSNGSGEDDGTPTAHTA